jgi:cytosine/adenosine deaminase-related metal-dependent hydrolase
MGKPARIVKDCILFYGCDLQPYWCHRLVIEDGVFSELSLGDPCRGLAGAKRVVMPGMVNSHTHIGDGFLADGATGLTLEEGFFRPNGYKYRELETIDAATHIASMVDTLSFMKRTGTVVHVDFREQGLEGAKRLRAASEQSDLRSIILSQLQESPFATSALEQNVDSLPAAALEELREILTVADGFSESTMNDLTDPAWQAIRQLTNTSEKARAIHCLENAGYRELSIARSGRGDLARALDLLQPDCVVHLTVANDEEIHLLAQSGIPAVINPRANAVLGLPMPPVAKLLAAGVKLLLGTDNVMLNSPNLFAEMDFTYKLARSQFGNAFDPDPLQILKMVTVNFANTRWGAAYPGIIAEGMPANAVVIDSTLPQLARSAHIAASIVTRLTPDAVLMTLHQGKPIYTAAHYHDT